MARWQEKPQTGQSVWRGGNGYITHIDYSFNVAYVEIHNQGVKEINLEEFEGCFDEGLNQWVIVEP